MTKIEVDESVAIAAPPSTVWQAISDGDLRARWWEDTDLDPVVGGGFEERWTAEDGSAMVTRGVVRTIVDDRMLALTWRDHDWPAETQVELSLAPEAGSTRVRLRHMGWERLPKGAALAEQHRAGWRMHLVHLATFAEAQIVSES